MSSALHKLEPEIKIQADPTMVFAVQCRISAYLWAAGEFGLHEAGDDLQVAAKSNGLVATIGQDSVQSLMSAGSAPYRRRELDQFTACDTCGLSPCMSRSFCRLCRQIDRKIPPAAPNKVPERGLAASTIDAFRYVVRQNDPKQLRTWLASHTPPRSARNLEKCWQPNESSQD